MYYIIYIHSQCQHSHIPYLYMKREKNIKKKININIEYFILFYFY